MYLICFVSSASERERTSHPNKIGDTIMAGTGKPGCESQSADLAIKKNQNVLPNQIT
jgi:hypothetical protein